MFSPLLIKISFATLSSIGVAVGGYFLYKKTTTAKTDSEKATPQDDVTTGVGVVGVPGVGGVPGASIPAAAAAA